MCGGRPTLGGERRRRVAKAILGRVSCPEKWAYGSKEGAKIEPSHLREG